MEIKGYDEWLWKQADDYMSQGDEAEYDEEAYEEARAEAEYERLWELRNEENLFESIHAHEFANGGKYGY